MDNKEIKKNILIDKDSIKKPLVSLSGIISYIPSINYEFNKNTLKFESRVEFNTTIKTINNKIWR